MVSINSCELHLLIFGLIWSRKIVGARYYYRGFEQQNGPLESFGRLFYRSARDDFNHGTHTASTAAGAMVTVTDALGGGTPLGAGPPRRDWRCTRHAGSTTVKIRTS